MLAWNRKKISEVKIILVIFILRMLRKAKPYRNAFDLIVDEVHGNWHRVSHRLPWLSATSMVPMIGVVMPMSMIDCLNVWRLSIYCYWMRWQWPMSRLLQSTLNRWERSHRLLHEPDVMRKPVTYLLPSWRRNPSLLQLESALGGSHTGNYAAPAAIYKKSQW